jgi:hypothetical protein
VGKRGIVGILHKKGKKWNRMVESRHLETDRDLERFRERQMPSKHGRKCCTYSPEMFGNEAMERKNFE